MTQVSRAAAPIPTLSLSHFRNLMGPHGLYQHATEKTPLLREGYCTDDNARAILVLLRAAAVLPPHELKSRAALLARCWQFILEARATAGQYHNFRAADGRWLPHEKSEDMYARLFRCLLAVLEYDNNAARRAAADEMVRELWQMVADFEYARSWAEVLVAIGQTSAAVRQTYDLAPLATRGAARLRALWQAHHTAHWNWFEPAITYANGLLPHGLLAVRTLVPEPWLPHVVHASTSFLLQATMVNSLFAPIGSHGWYPRGGLPSRDNEQPIDAGVMLDFLIDYRAAFPAAMPVPTVAAPYLWFFGANLKKVALADAATGASYDGLFMRGPNTNCGAESMLAYLWAEIRLQQAEPALRTHAALQRQQLFKSPSAPDQPSSPL